MKLFNPISSWPSGKKGEHFYFFAFLFEAHFGNFQPYLSGLRFPRFLENKLLWPAIQFGCGCYSCGLAGSRTKKKEQSLSHENALLKDKTKQAQGNFFADSRLDIIYC
jgi:hypothetical protein